jgi:Transposase domain (DUF772)
MIMWAPTIPCALSTPACDRLDLKAAGFARVEAKATGRPGYAPGDLLRLYLYGYLNRVRSSRRLEAECATGGSRVKNLAEKIEALKKKRGEYAAHLSALEKSGESQMSLTDPIAAPWQRIRRSASPTTFRLPSTQNIK